MTTENNEQVIEHIKKTYWGGNSEMTFNVPVDKTFRTEKGLREQISAIPETTEKETDVGSGLIYVAIPDNNASGVMIAPVVVEREE